jgi:hypothetical protein
MSTYFTRIAAAGLLAAAGLSAASCTMRDSQSNSYLIIDSLGAIRGGDDSAEPSATLQSDVLTNNGFFEDLGVVTFRLGLKDPGSPTVPNVATSNNFITVDRYRVTYARADGRNTPGVDVPFSFDGAFTVTVVAAGEAEASFPLVRVQAKEEQPLRNLIGNFGQGVISTIATVTFYGKDQTGRAVSATGKISINFADWGDPE